jgi:hypothetical protein
VDQTNFATSVLSSRQGVGANQIIKGVSSTLRLLQDKDHVLGRLKAKAILVQRPVKPKSSEIWDLDLVWRYLATRPWSSLSLEQKRDRLIMTLSLDTMCRRADLANTFLERLNFGNDGARDASVRQDGVHITFFEPKENAGMRGHW